MRIFGLGQRDLQRSSRQVTLNDLAPRQIAVCMSTCSKSVNPADLLATGGEAESCLHKEVPCGVVVPVGKRVVSVLVVCFVRFTLTHVCLSKESLLEEQARRSKKQKDKDAENKYTQQAHPLHSMKVTETPLRGTCAEAKAAGARWKNRLAKLFLARAWDCYRI